MPLHLESALESLKQGEFVLLHDSAGRENEIDMVASAKMITPEHIARMRMHAGGLLCAAIDHGFASSLGLRYMHDILADAPNAVPDIQMIMGLAPYGDHPTFSISVNHYRTYTGITDSDRALTINKLADIHAKPNRKKMFTSSFKTPGHVPILVASDGMLTKRQGHTEMSVYLVQLAGLPPVTAICEMMDAQTYTALSLNKAAQFARQHGIPLVDGAELLEYAKVH